MGAEHDIAGLATAAISRTGDLRSLLLLTHTRAFAMAPRRDPGVIATFEALALGLIPLVPHAVRSVAAGLLIGVAETPPEVAALLRQADAACAAHLTLLSGTALAEARRPDLGTHVLDDLVRLDDPAVDLALASNAHIVLHGRHLAALCDRALGRPGLAASLLERPEPTVFDRAALYRYAAPTMRDRIRTELARVLPDTRPPRNRRAGDELGALAAARDLDGFVAAVDRAAGERTAEPFPTHWASDPELLVLALLAIGRTGSEAIGMYLTLSPPLGGPGPDVFRLATVARDTPAGVAARITGRSGPARSLAEVAARASARVAARRASQP